MMKLVKKAKTADCPLGMLVFLGFLSLGFANQPWAWRKTDAGITSSKINCVSASFAQPSLICAGTDTGLFYFNNQESAYNHARLPSKEQRINDIYIEEGAPRHIYAASDAGVFESVDEGKTWKEIFKKLNPDEQKCYAVVARENDVFVGTAAGLYIKEGSKRGWRRFSGELGRKPVLRFDRDKTFVYAATPSKLYRIGKVFANVQEIFTASSGESGIGEDEDTDFLTGIKAIGIDHNSGVLLLVTSKAILKSNDQGAIWNRITTNGLDLDGATSILGTGEGNIILATLKGVYRYNGKSWQALYRGMETSRVYDLAEGTGGAVYAASDKGLFTFDRCWDVRDMRGHSFAGLKRNSEFINEPSIQEVHRLAIHYAEVDPKKIKRWREQARKKAWWPDMHVSIDGDKNRTINDSVWGSYSNGGQQYIGPDDKTFYDNFGWGVSFSWDLGDVIWNSDQTSIDSRSKMMVELREDILDQVTRLYFERRRTQIEFKTLQEQEADESLMMEKELRLEELTALIDAYTGGEFSRRIEQNTRIAAGSPDKKEVMK